MTTDIIKALTDLTEAKREHDEAKAKHVGPDWDYYGEWLIGVMANAERDVEIALNKAIDARIKEALK